LRAAIRRAVCGGQYIDATLAAQLIRGESGTAGAFRPGRRMLSRREQEVMTRIARGEALTSIASSLFLSIKTVSTYRRQILDKLQLNSNADLVRYAVRNGLD